MTLLTDLDDDFFIFPSWREILLVLGFSFRLNAREEDVLVFPLESSQLDLLNTVLNFLNSLIGKTIFNINFYFIYFYFSAYSREGRLSTTFGLHSSIGTSNEHGNSIRGKIKITF